ncbi:MAG TPA: cytochrome c [Pseudomonadales bacterium]
MRNAFFGYTSCIVMLVVFAGCSKPTLAGRDLYSAHCANCHGRYADGEGPVAADLPAIVPDLRYLAKRNGGAFPREWVTDVIDGREIVQSHGDRHMPVWGDAFTEMDAANGSSKAKIQSLVDYLVEIQQSN